MAADKQARRAAALTQWANAAAGVGFDVPTDNDIRSMAADPDGWQRQAPSSAALDWVDTVTHINHQIKFGMDPSEVVRHLPEELRTPRSGPPRPKTEVASVAPESEPGESTDDEEPSALDALFSWRAKRVASGDAAAASIKDVTFHNLIKYGHTSANQIRRQLRGPSVALADNIAEVFSSFGGGDHSDLEKPEQTAAVVEKPVAQKPVAPQSSRRAEKKPAPAHRRSEEEQAVESLPASELAGLQHSDFCEYDFGSTFEKSTLSISAKGGGYSLSWPAYPSTADAVVLYRVVSGENTAPYKPEVGELLGVTTQTNWTDERFTTSAVRVYQVWAHSGRDVTDAASRQPELLAEGETVSPVTDFVLDEDEGRVIGRWSAWTGTRAVRIYRIPLDGASPVSNDPRYQIHGSAENLTGFVDVDVERGQRYLYRALSEVTVGAGTRQSRAAQNEILVSVVLQPVDDLVVESEGSGTASSFDLAWTDPESGTVVVYRTEEPPDAGLRFENLPESALEVQGLTPRMRLAHPAVAGGAGTSRMHGVPWPTGWDRAYLTPVTLLNGSARVGNTTVQTRPIDPVTDARIIERCSSQVVTFGWPKSAASVFAYIGPRNHTPEDLLEGQPALEISAGRYQRDGGLTFRTPLPPSGCSVHLVPIAYSRGERVTGTVTTLDYQGLTEMRYRLDRSESADGRQRVSVFVASRVDTDPPAPFILVHNRTRLPLSARDGEPMAMTDINDHTGRQARQFLPPRLGPKWVDSGCSADIADMTGYIRLFLDIDAASASRYALLDPPVFQLVLPPNLGPSR